MAGLAVGGLVMLVVDDRSTETVAGGAGGPMSTVVASSMAAPPVAAPPSSGPDPTVPDTTVPDTPLPDTTVPDTTVPDPARATPATPPADAPGSCAPAGEPWLDLAVGPPLRRLDVAGAALVLAPPDPGGDQTAEVVRGVAASTVAAGAVAARPGDPGTVAVVLSSAEGRDRLLVGTGPEMTWSTVADGEDVSDPAVSSSGTRVAFVADGQLGIAAADEWSPTPVPSPVPGARAGFVRFVDDNRVVAALEEPATGLNLIQSAHSEIWSYDLAARRWTALTSDPPPFGRLSLARSPVAAPDGTLFYVRLRGSAADAADAQAELRRVTGPAAPGLTDIALGEAPADGLLLAVAADGQTVWNEPGPSGEDAVSVWGDDGTMLPIGCGQGRRRPANTTLAPPGGALLDAAVDAPDPFVVFDGGRPWVFTTNAGRRNVPVAGGGPGGDPSVTSVTDALPDLPPWAAPGFTWAPAATHTGDGWTLWFTAQHVASGRQCIGSARAERPEGPYHPVAEPLVCDLARGGSIDPSPVVDDDGRLLLLYKSDGNCCGLPSTIDQVELDPTGTRVIGPRIELLRADQAWEGGVIEAPTMARGPTGRGGSSTRPGAGRRPTT